MSKEAKIGKGIQMTSTLSLLMVLMLAGCSKSMPCNETSKAAALMTAGTATATPLLVLATSSTEPIPACHHCPVAPPKVEKHRRHKKRPEGDVKICDVGGCRPPDDADRMRYGSMIPELSEPSEAMTPQQFTDFMDDNFPAIPARKYPPDYKLPKGEQ